MINGCNIFGGQKFANTCSFVGGRIIVQQEKMSTAERSWTKPLNALQGAKHYSFIKYCIYCFSLWYEFFVQYALRFEKYYQYGLDERPLEFQCLRPRESFINPLRTLALVSETKAKHQVSSPVIILLKNFVCIGHRDNVLARRDSIFPLLRCQGVWNKTCTQLSLFQILFQNLKNYSLVEVQRFCYNSLCDSTVIFAQISNISNVYVSSSRFWTATSLVIFYQLPSVSKSRVPPKNV